MKALFAVAILLAVSPTIAFAQVQGRVGNKTILMTPKPATQGDGYAIESKIKGVKPLCVSVSLTCGDGTSASACCPTSSYATYCPNARISCD